MDSNTGPCERNSDAERERERYTRPHVTAMQARVQRHATRAHWRAARQGNTAGACERAGHGDARACVHVTRGEMCWQTGG